MRLRELAAHDSLFWRRLAHLGASRFPEWWVRYTPPVFGWAAALAVPQARRAVLGNLRRIRGEASPVEDARQLLSTFGTYAGCLAEALAMGSKNDRDPRAVVHGADHVRRVLKEGKGAVFATAHTAGWEIVGPLLSRDLSIDVMMVMERERDAEARRLHDQARRSRGLHIAHIGEDPLASLPLLSHVRKGGIVALQIDRKPKQVRARKVRIFDEPGEIPEGPLRIAQLTGAPVIPIFAARTGYRSYVVEADPPIFIKRRPTEEDLDQAAAKMADALTRFLRAHPTQWFHFHDGA
jgi:lauroyl/myristoyl acyltransferase